MTKNGNTNEVKINFSANGLTENGDSMSVAGQYTLGADDSAKRVLQFGSYFNNGSIARANITLVKGEDRAEIHASPVWQKAAMLPESWDLRIKLVKDGQESEKETTVTNGTTSPRWALIVRSLMGAAIKQSGLVAVGASGSYTKAQLDAVFAALIEGKITPDQAKAFKDGQVTIESLGVEIPAKPGK